MGTSILKNNSYDTEYRISSLLAPLYNAMITKSYPANVGVKHQSINQSINLTVSRDGHHKIAEATVT